VSPALDEAATIVELARRGERNAALGHIDNLPGARVYVRNANQFAAYVPRGSIVLDWGCGAGHMSWLLTNRGFSVIATEFKPEVSIPDFLQRSDYRALTHPIRLPLKDGSVAAVLSSGTLEHSPLVSASLAELRRVLAPDGRFVIFRFPNQYSISEWMARRSGRWSHAIKMSRAELRFLLRCYSFRVEAIGYDSWLPIYLGRQLQWLRPLRERFDAPLTMLDRVLTSAPGIQALSTSMHVFARVNNEYGSQQLL